MGKDALSAEALPPKGPIITCAAGEVYLRVKLGCLSPVLLVSLAPVKQTNLVQYGKACMYSDNICEDSCVHAHKYTYV